jgi:DNA replication protein DnaC
MPELLDQIRPSGSHPDAAMQRAISVPLLVLDDLGGERPTDWTLERLFVVVNRRWLEGRPIIASSNLAVDNGQGPLPDAIGARTYSRLVGDAVVVQMAGRDLRRVV